MIFYLSLGVLFTIYALDLIWLVGVAAMARSAEVAALLRKRSQARTGKRQQERQKKKQEKDAKKKEQQKDKDKELVKAVADVGGVAAVDGGGSGGAKVAPGGAAASHATAAAAAAAATALPISSARYIRPPAGAVTVPGTGGGGGAAGAMGGVLGGSPGGSSEFCSTDADSGSSRDNDDDDDDGSSSTDGDDGLARAEIITGPAAAAAGHGGAAAAAAAAAANGTTAITVPEDPWAGGQPPKVLLQLPMYNEEAHAAAIIQACCRIRYPRDRLLIQVLDDSTKEAVRQRVDAAAAACIEEGHPVQVMRRDNRSGFKAGAMVEGLNRVEGLGYEYCAIFDADFSPPADFLEETIPVMHRDRRLAYVQTRWAFSNAGQSFLTWAQKVNLCFHFDVEQRARSYLGWFFNFNGTAGVWRIQSIHDAGGWQSDTVVEDMDLSLRCYLRGWNALYLPHVDNPNELPCTLSSYKTQQFRWLSGPMQILIKSFSNIWHAKDISLGRRVNAFWFFLRYLLFAAITVGVLAVPPVALWVEAWDWSWPQIYFIVSINFALAVYLYVTPFSVFYLFFSVAIGYFKLWAMVSGLLGLEKSKTWKVTQKFGAKQAGGGLLHRIHKPYALETCLAVYYGGMAAAAGVYGSWIMLGYCALMALVFLVISFGDAYM